MIRITVPAFTRAVLIGSLVGFSGSAAAQSKPAAKPKTQSTWAQTDAFMRDKLGTSGSWQVSRVQTDGDGIMRVVLKDSSVTELQYQTMVQTSCYHLTQPKAPKTPKEIAFVNVHERTGYVFEAPDRCGEFLKLPPARLKLALLAVTHLF